MKVKLYCHTCIMAWIDNPPTSQEMSEACVATPLQDFALYEVTCPKGHVRQVILQNFKHELLFESGMYALRDGYYREAVSSFAVALERFYEYCIRMLLSNEVDTIDRDDFELTWKSIAKQSERQIGAFYMLYLKINKISPTAFDSRFFKNNKLNLNIEGNDPVNFRNRVIHSGYIPTFEQALLFGEGVNIYINNLLREFINDTDKYDISRVISDSMHDAILSTTGVDASIATSVSATFISVISRDNINKGLSLVEYVNNGYKH